MLNDLQYGNFDDNSFDSLQSLIGVKYPKSNTINSESASLLSPSYPKLGEEDLGTEQITISSAGYTTYVTENALIFPDNVECYVVDYIFKSSEYIGTAHCVRVKIVPPNTPLIIKGSQGTYNVKIVRYAPSVGQNLLRYSDTGVNPPDRYKYYALSRQNNIVALYNVLPTVEIMARKCYLVNDTGFNLSRFDIGIPQTQNLLFGFGMDNNSNEDTGIL